jgi:hypothetical protein
MRNFLLLASLKEENWTELIDIPKTAFKDTFG